MTGRGAFPWVGRLHGAATSGLRGYAFAVGPTVTSAAASGLAAATTLVVARGVGAAEFGVFTVVLTIATIAMIAMLLNLNYVMYQELPRAQPSEHPAIVTTALLSTVAVSGGLAALALLASPALTVLLGVDLRTLGFALGLAAALSVNLLTDSFLRGMRRFVLVARLKLAVSVAYLGASAFCLLVLDLRDAEVYLGLLIATNLAFTLVAVAYLDLARPTWSQALARSMYRHGAHLSVTALLTAAVLGLDVLFLNHWADEAVVGVYSVYNGFPKRLLGVVFTEGVGLVLLPVLATLDKPRLLRRIARLAPLVALATALLSFAASAVFFLVLREEYPYSLPLMALSAAGIGAHTVFNLYFFALSMDGVRGAKVFTGCLAVGLPVAVGLQAALIAWNGLVGALTAFLLTNLLLVAIVVVVAARVYRADPAPGSGGDRGGDTTPPLAPVVGGLPA